MSSIEEIDRKMKEVANQIVEFAKQIGEVQSAITTLENDSGNN